MPFWLRAWWSNTAQKWNDAVNKVSSACAGAEIRISAQKYESVLPYLPLLAWAHPAADWSSFPSPLTALTHSPTNYPPSRPHVHEAIKKKKNSMKVKLGKFWKAKIMEVHASYLIEIKIKQILWNLQKMSIEVTRGKRQIGPLLPHSPSRRRQWSW